MRRPWVREGKEGIVNWNATEVAQLPVHAVWTLYNTHDACWGTMNQTLSLDLKGASASSRTKFAFYRYADWNDLWYVTGNPLVLIFICHFFIPFAPVSRFLSTALKQPIKSHLFPSDGTLLKPAAPVWEMMLRTIIHTSSGNAVFERPPLVKKSCTSLFPF